MLPFFSLKVNVEGLDGEEVLGVWLNYPGNNNVRLTSSCVAVNVCRSGINVMELNSLCQFYSTRPLCLSVCLSLGLSVSLSKTKLLLCVCPVFLCSLFWPKLLRFFGRLPNLLSVALSFQFVKSGHLFFKTVLRTVKRCRPCQVELHQISSTSLSAAAAVLHRFCDVGIKVLRRRG